MCFAPGGSAVAGTTTVLPSTEPTGSGATVSGPTVRLDHTRVAPGQQIQLTIMGFTAKVVTISVCGNNALRGSTDCDMPSSHGIGLTVDGADTTDTFVVSAPPIPCPCIVRVASLANDEIATAPVTVVGHPTAPLVHGAGSDVGSSGLVVVVQPTAHPKGVGAQLKWSLGGGVDYTVVVSVRNSSDAFMDDLTVIGFVGRSANDTIASLALTKPGPLAPGHTWSQTVKVTVPAPTFGGIQFHVTASHNGVPVTNIATVRHRPWLLVGLGLFLLFDVTFLLVRSRVRARKADQLGAEPSDSSSQPSQSPPIDASSSEGDLNGADHDAFMPVGADH
ncbi:MAG: hypothetical protein WCI22_19000, partial [Actinomycetota bacterium]